MTLEQAAQSFLHQYYTEQGKTGLADRLNDVYQEIEATGTYVQTAEELAFGAKAAWRNANKCIGRLFWDTLTVFDKRHVNTPDEVISACRKHLRYTTNGGKIRPAMTIFPPSQPGKPPEWQLLNHQLIRYAGYEDGRGDPASAALTKQAQAAGWKGKGTDFDILPLLIQKRDGSIHLYEWEAEEALEVPLRHPEEEAFSNLQLKWYAVPAIADMEIEIGGIVYPCSPFNGWYMGTEIGARNLADTWRYNCLEAVASVFGLDTAKPASLWKDRALVELNRAVIYSFHEEGVSLVDHHTAAEQFRIFCDKEKKAGRAVTGDWTWLIPPMSPAAVHVFHEAYNDEEKSPRFAYRKASICPFTGQSSKEHDPSSPLPDHGN
ncbi:nitric oxide synthase oxygenase [Bacillus daqingensis]|uniref:Nitric oxide synthase oxygenase n=1 Tax=Bacillus daqingensis TaxID=872396 RepID=A0ABV9NNR2_9BACI